MGLLDQIAGQLPGALGSKLGAQGELVQMILGLVQNHDGGLAGLLQKLSQGGLADQAASWVGTGRNLPVSAGQMQAALGDEAIAGMAGKMGLSSTEASGALADLLPGLVDQLTPEGRIPDGDALGRGLASLAGKLLG